jgi:HlyD family secretion protein
MTVELPARSSAAPRAPSPEEVAKRIGAGRRARIPRWAIVLAVLFVLGMVVAGVLYSRKLKPKATQYETAEVTRGRLEVTISATGTLSAVGAVEVGSEVSGKIQKVHVADNARVAKGQVLAEIDPMQLASDVAQTSAQAAASRAAIAQADATATEAHLARERAEEQAKLGLIAKKDLETARASDARAAAAVLSAKANGALTSTAASTARWKLTRTKIVAPIDGIVLARLIEPGQVVQASFQTPVLFRLATNLTRLELKVDIDEADVGKAKEGQKSTFQVDAWPDKQFPSVLTAILNEAKTTNGVVTYSAVLSVDNSDLSLRPGMTASATIVTEARDNTLLVPSGAFRFSPPTTGGSMGGPPGPLGGPPGPSPTPSATTPKDPRNKFVWVLEANGQLRSVEVRPEATDGQKTAVTGDLLPGMRVALDTLEAQ